MQASSGKKKGPDPMAQQANQIYERLEERAIAESNELNRRVAQCRLCRRGDFIPTVGSGHPFADIVLVKYAPRYLEVTEGVAFFGRSGSAILKSVEKLGLDPLLIYGTNLVKCAGVDEREGAVNCPCFFLEELHITQPKLLVVMGEGVLEVLNRNLLPGQKPLMWRPGEIQEFSHFCSALVTPDIDEALDDRRAKVAFWKAFRAVGDWFHDEPPY
jgi:uracil-DNA glycosylase